MENECPRVVVVGSGTRDVFADRTADGGAVRYGARVVEAFGERAGLVVLDTADASGPDAAFEAHALERVDGGARLTFEIRASDDHRELRVLERPSRALALDAVPAAWREPDLLVLGPLLPDDLDVASFLAARPHWMLVVAQGLLRAVDAPGVVRPLGRLPEALRSLARAQTVIAVSEEETAGWVDGDIESLAAAGAVVLLTEGAAGAEVITATERFHVEPGLAVARDTTGAGDVFATAFACAIALGVTASLRDAGRLAAQFAAASIEAEGAAPLPGVGTMMARAGLAPQAVDAGAAG